MRKSILRIMLFVSVLVISALLLSACSEKRNVEGSTYYLAQMFDSEKVISIKPKGITFATDSVVIWETMGDMSLEYEIDGDTVVFSSPSYGGVGQFVDDYEFPEDYEAHQTFKSENKIDVRGKQQVLLFDDEVYVKLDPSVFDNSQVWVEMDPSELDGD